MRVISLSLALFLLLSACSAGAQTWQAPDEFQAQSLIPPLEIPEGVQMLGGGGGGGAGSEGRAADFVSDMSLEELHAFFAGQLQAAGWSETDQQAGDGQLVTFWELSDDKGYWAARLKVAANAAVDPGAYSVEVKLLQPR